MQKVVFRHARIFFKITLIFLLVCDWLFIAWPQAYNFPPKIRDARAVVAFEQEGYRFRNDNGSESSATWLTNEDTWITQPKGTNTRLRTLINATDDPTGQSFQLEYKKSTDAGYRKVGPAPETAAPIVQGRSTGASAAVNTTTHPITMPTGIQAGELLLIVFSSDTAPDTRIESGEWVKLDQATNLSIVHGSIFYKIAQGSDTATVTTPSAEQSTHVVYRISGAGIPYSASANGSSINSNPPNLNTGTTRNYLWIATRSGDAQVVATVAPFNYTNMQTVTAAGIDGASTNTAEYTHIDSSEDPGTFTSATEQWVSFTIAIPPAFSNYGVRGVGPEAEGSTSLSIPYPGNIGVGDILVMMIGNKYPTNGPTTPTGWTAHANNQASGGVGASGLDTGFVYTTVYTRVADGTESGNVSVSIPSGDSADGHIISVRPASGKMWATPVLANGSDNTASSNDWIVTAGSDPGITAGDIVLVASTSNHDGLGYVSHAVTSTGVTFSNQVELTESATSQGQDLEVTLSFHLAASGTSSAAPVFTMTSTSNSVNAPAGSSVFVRLRQTDAPIQLADSSNITASGENTTAQLTPPTGKTTSNFTAGRIQDDENPADSIDIASGGYTELEWNLIGTTTATDGEVYQFRVTNNGTALDTYTVSPQWTIGTAETPDFDLLLYRWYVDNDEVDPTDPWGETDIAENAPITIFPRSNNAPGPGTELRLRTGIFVSGNMPASSQQFKLQYKPDTAVDCWAGTWTDVGASGSGSIWRFATSTPSDGALVTPVLSASDVSGHYTKSNPTVTNTNSVFTFDYIEYDFHIEQNGAAGATQYIFRVVKSDDSTLTDYSACPYLTTLPGPESLMRHGRFFLNNAKQSFIW